MKKLRIGVLGLGEGRSVISAVEASEYWELGAICDLNEELCRERIREFNLGIGYLTSYEEMLKDDSLDVIGIYTPDQLHAKHIIMALEAGKHVICTKPLMVDLTMAQPLLDAQKKAGKHVFIGQSSRYFEAAMRQRRDYENGENGQLVTVEAAYVSDSRWFLERSWSHEEGFSWMYNFLNHAVDLAVWYLPHVEEVYGVGVTSANSASRGVMAPDALKFLLKDRSGICASVNGAYAVPALGTPTEHYISCTLRGTMGASKADCPFDYTHHFSKLGKHVDTTFENYEHLRPYYYRFEGDTHHAGEYQNYYEYFARCIEDGTTPLPDLKEGIRTIAVMEAMNRCLRSGQVEKVQPVLDEYGLVL
ncbi:MAG: Gfo/Idh/MocA family oxidoreductase [Clostridia bacterium]|nr:Gfo/Idh/MocA family oxidoreductase [Clostridia bacterium]